MRFTKLQSVGNDFVLVAPDGQLANWPGLAKAVCHRHFGVGADGLLLLMPSRAADFKMRIFNADGSEAEACGNGLRCLVHYLFQTGQAAGRTTLSIETFAGVRQARILEDGCIQTSMGEPRFTSADIPLATHVPGHGASGLIHDFPLNISGRRLLVSLVSMGNPHAVHFHKSTVSDFPLEQVGPLVEGHRLFPQRINFEVAHVLDRRHIEVRVWERGAGETLGCGSGACAVAVAAQLQGFTDSDVDIMLPGGTLGVQWAGIGEVFISGQAEIVFTGEWLKQ